MGHYCDVCCFTTTTKCHRCFIYGPLILKNLVVVIKFELVM